MRYVKPESRRIVIAHGMALFTIGVLAMVPWALVAAEASLEDKAAQDGEKKDQAVQKDRTEKGRFVSFKDDTLTLKAKSGELLKNKISESTKTLIWNEGKRLYEPTDTAAALNQAKVGTWFVVQVAKENVTVRIGSIKGGQASGTFVSYKDERLMMLVKNLSPSATKLYGNTAHFQKFWEDVPVYESIDGGEYKLVGTPSVLGNVKEGTIITVHQDADDNIILIQIGVPKKQ